jgi:hypothetical protein
MQTEVHVYAFSVSAGMLLSFFPFLTLMLSLCRYVFKWKAAVNAIFFALDDYFPDAFGHYLSRNLQATVESRGPVQIISLVLLFFTASGIFEPLEVALNRIWNCPRNRSYFKNQLVSLGLIFACGALMLLSITLTAMNNQFLAGAASKPAGAMARGSDVDAAAVSCVLAAAQLQAAGVPDRSIGHPGRIAAGTSEVRQPSDVAVSAGQAGAGVWPVRVFDHDHPVGIRDGAGGFGGRGVDGATFAEPSAIGCIIQRGQARRRTVRERTE